MALSPAGPDVPASPETGRPSRLSHWPVKLRLLNPAAPYLSGSDLLLLADCAAVACPDLHDRLLAGRTVALACPKFEDVDLAIERLSDIIRAASPASITVAHMEVPCCNGLFVIAERAVAKSGAAVPVARIILARSGQLITKDDSARDVHARSASIAAK